MPFGLRTGRYVSIRDAVAEVYRVSSGMQQLTQTGVITGEKLLALIESFDDHDRTPVKERTLQWRHPQIKPTFPDRFDSWMPNAPACLTH